MSEKQGSLPIDYDFNGNILKMYRTSIIENNNIATVIDKLDYMYTGNKLTNVHDGYNNPSGYEGGGNTITYDPNGNMTNMQDKGITSIVYNFLNLPDKINMLQSEVGISYLYSSNGTKLQKIKSTFECGIIDCYSINAISDYLDGFQYMSTTISRDNGGGIESLSKSIEMSKAMEIQAYTLTDIISPIDPGIDPPIGGGVIIAGLKDTNLSFFPTAEGYYDYKKDQYIYQYRDHLGNVRLSFGRNSTGALEITDANDYYPFGMNHLKTGNAFFGKGSYKNYKYNGKELQETGMYDYGARMYMPDIGRWGVVDPKSQYTHETYSYVWNNPIKFTDPTVMMAETFGIIGYPDRDGRADGEYWRDSDGEFYWDAKNSVWKDFNDGSSIITQVNLLGKSTNSDNSGYATAMTLGIATSESGVGLVIIGVAGLIYIIDQATKPPLQWHTTIADPGAGYGSMNTEDSAEEDKDVNGVEVPNDSISGNENRKDGGKNGQHKNLKAKQSAGEKYEEAKAEYERLKSKPGKTKDDVKARDTAEKQMKHWKKKADETGENHSRNAKGSR